MGWGGAQSLKFTELLNDRISIRAIQVYGGKVWYAGNRSRVGFVDMGQRAGGRQIRVSWRDSLEFRTLAQNSRYFYTINIGSPAELFQIDKKTLAVKTLFKDTLKTAFYDALIFYKNNERAIGLSDPAENRKLNILTTHGDARQWYHCYDCPQFPVFEKGEAAFAASNTNIAAKGRYLWMATGGAKSRILRSKDGGCEWEVFETPFVQGTSSQGIYSLDFADEKFGVAVGGDYTRQSANVNNIATTLDSGRTWQIQASGANGGYKSCVKIRPGSKGREMIAVGDRNIEFSGDFGRTWNTISEEKGLYVCEWVDKNTLVFAGKNRILKAKLVLQPRAAGKRHPRRGDGASAAT